MATSLKPAPKGKITLGQWKVPPRPLVIQKVVHVGEARTQNQETIEKRRSSVKQLSHLVDRFHWLPAEALLKWVVTVINSGAGLRLVAIALNLVLNQDPPQHSLLL